MLQVAWESAFAWIKASCIWDSLQERLPSEWNTHLICHELSAQILNVQDVEFSTKVYAASASPHLPASLDLAAAL